MHLNLGSTPNLVQTAGCFEGKEALRKVKQNVRLCAHNVPCGPSRNSQACWPIGREGGCGFGAATVKTPWPATGVPAASVIMNNPPS